MTFRIRAQHPVRGFARLGEEVRAVAKAGADLIHFDVMDNHYVPNLTVGPLVCAALRPHVELPLDVHLDGEAGRWPGPGVRQGGCQASSAFHPEASSTSTAPIALIREHGCKAGLALIATPLTCLDHTLEGSPAAASCR